MEAKASPSSRYLMVIYLAAVAVVSFLVLKLIMWLDGAK